MVGLMFIPLALGIWLLVIALTEWDWLLGVVDLSYAQLVLGEEALRWMVVGFAASLAFVAVLGLI
jgi:hypothetical protein